MPLFDDAKQARQLICDAEQARDAVVGPGEDRRLALQGLNFRRINGAKKSWTNAYFNLFQTLVPGLTRGGGYTEVNTENPAYGMGIGREVAEAMEQGLNANAKQTNLHLAIAQAVTSSLFDIGWTYTGLEVVPGYENRLTGERTMDWMPPPMRPRTWFMPSRLTFHDPTKHPLDGGYGGHVWIKRAEELRALKDPETGEQLIDPKLVDKMTIDSDADSIRGSGAFGRWVRRTAKRGDVVGYTVWCRETGMEYMLTWKGKDSTAEEHFLTQPRKLFGHPAGPYTAWGLFWIEDMPFPFPITAAMQTIVDAREKHREKLDQDMLAAMKLTVANGHKNAMKLAEARNRRLLNWPGFDKNNFATIETGGMQDATVVYEAMLGKEQAEVTAISANRLGNLDPQVPATAVLDAAQELDARKQFAKDAVDRCAAIEAEKRGWLLYHSRSCQFPIAGVDPETGQETSSVFIGGVLPDEKGLKFDDFSFEMKPGSMGHTASAVAVAEARELMTDMSTVLMLAQDPRVQVKNLADLVMDAHNKRGGSKRFFHPRVVEVMQEMAAAQVGAAAVQMGMQQAQPPEGPGAPAGPAGPTTLPKPPAGQPAQGSTAPPAQPGAPTGRSGGSPGASDVRSVGAQIGAKTRQGKGATPV
jgi:hypothetical protein